MPAIRFPRWLVLVALLAGLGSVSSSQVTQQQRIRKKLDDEFGLTGTWRITRMEVSKVMIASSNPGRPAGEVAIDLGSSLVEGSFEVQSSGTIVGHGRAVYRLRVSAGSAFRQPVPFGLAALITALPVGAAVTLDAEENGERSFNISGQAEAANRTISLKSFQPVGGPLKLIVQPSSARMEFATWPPMTNVAATRVITEGAGLVLRAAGNVGGINVSIEAVKHVDLEGLLRLFETSISSGRN